MASHCLSNEEAQKIFDDLKVRNNSLEEAFETINAELTKGFGLEIATVVLEKQKYHAVINLRNDDVAANAFESSYNSHERAFVRKILEQFCSSDDKHPSFPKKDLINLRNELEDSFKITTVDHAKTVVERLLDQQFLRIVSGGRRDSMQVEVEMAPRGYLELSTFMTERGVSHDNMPQFLFHRS
eukprot:CAMPEP_0176116638 /NCGR_PEP_ID=MMETSP0120_2-20121206/58587_1 /TAXON_ID=160619 /ORGANISM="Kryptoperidinium foliaceum, Strain CCMP 1326" /LENGTH=183 /DNA_ID=CAMNT_0017450907 /DNA_START=9 /DNA_END=560 /DNA_ORIENTATION=-